MKKIILLLLVLSVMACSAPSIPQPNFEYKETVAGLSLQADPEDLQTIMSAGPLYTLSEAVDNPTLKKYRQLRNARVTEMIEMMIEAQVLFDETIQEMPKYRELVLGLLGFLSEGLDEKDPDQGQLKVYVLDTVQRYTNAVIKTTARQANQKGLLKALEETKTNSKSAEALFWYSYYYQSQLMVKDLSHELTYFPGRLVGLVSYVQNNKQKFSSQKFIKAISNYEANLDNFLKDVQGPFQKAIKIELDIALGFRFLLAADYAFTRGSLEYVKDTSHEILKMVEKTPVRGEVTGETKDFYNTYAIWLGKFSETALNDLSRVKKPRELATLIPVSGLIPTFLLATAHAGVTDWLSQAAGGLTQKIKGAGEATFGAASSCVTSPWQCTKSAFQTAQKGVGMAVDSVNMAVGVSMDVGANLYYGNSFKDFKDISGGNMVQMYKSWDEGKMGSTVLKTAREYLDSTEKGVGSTTAGMVSTVFGDGYTSWGAGKLAEMTTGMATGFGKGMLALANTQSTSEELLEGTIDVAFSFTGGSKAVVKGSQLLTGTQELGKQVAKKGAQELEKVSIKMQTDVLKESSNKLLNTAAKKLNEAELQIIYSNTKQIVANEAKQNILEQAEKKVAGIMGELAEKTGQKVWGNLKEVPESISSFTTKKFELSMQGLKEAGKEVFGGTLKDWGNNVFSGVADNFIKDFAKTLLPPAQSQEIQSKENIMAPVAGLPLQDPAVKEALGKISNIYEEAQQNIQQSITSVDAQAAQAVQNKIQETVVNTAIEEAQKELSKPVTASGSFSGSYSGGVTMTLIPAGGGVSGTVTTDYGRATISGSVSKDGVLQASVNGGMRFENYEGVWENCTLHASMNGTLRGRGASGDYSGSCAKEGDSGNWNVSW
ncbi:MAG: hypothetical protein HQM16_15485 [Deltaproteobacteria bacterium]|nr:hypothetical protein [Deltaproteobacteria bacterium]